MRSISDIPGSNVLLSIHFPAVGEGQVQVTDGGFGGGDGGCFVASEVMRRGFHVGDRIVELMDGRGDARVHRALVLGYCHGGEGTDYDAEQDIAKGFHVEKHTGQSDSGQSV